MRVVLMIGLLLLQWVGSEKWVCACVETRLAIAVRVVG